MKKKLYIACALTHAPEEFRQMIWKLRDLFRAAGFEILEFAWKDGPRHDVNVYQLDMEEKVDDADMIVAICDYPSIGLGMEFEHAVRRKPCKPLFAAFAKKDVRVSKIVGDFLEYHGLPPVVPYDKPEDIVFEVTSYLERLEELKEERHRNQLWS